MGIEEFPELAAIAAGRDHLTTKEFARVFSKSPRTVRKNYCLDGECYGIRPIKPASNLLWPVIEIVAGLRRNRK